MAFTFINETEPKHSTNNNCLNFKRLDMSAVNVDEVLSNLSCLFVKTFGFLATVSSYRDLALVCVVSDLQFAVGMQSVRIL